MAETKPRKSSQEREFRKAIALRKKLKRTFRGIYSEPQRRILFKLGQNYGK